MSTACTIVKPSVSTLAWVVVLGLGTGARAQTTDFPEQPPVAPLLDPARLPAPSSAALDNGMAVVVISNDELPWVSISWHLRAGAAFDPPATAGLASATAQLLREGTERYSSDAFADRLDRAAISMSAGAGHHTTTVRVSALRQQTALAVELQAEALRRPTFPERDFKRAMNQAVQGMSVGEQDGGYQAQTTLDRWLYGDHYLSRPAMGTSGTVKAVRREDVIAFHRQHYMPNQATLVFSGDISAAAALALARLHFGDWPRGAPLSLPEAEMPAPEDTRIVIVDRPDATQAQIRIGQLGFERLHPDYVVSQVFNQVFGGSFVSRLNKRIRVKEGYTYGARGGFSASRDRGALRISTFTRPEKVGETVQALLEEVHGIRDLAPNPEELSDGKSSLIGRFSLSLETPQQVADKIWELKFYGLPDDYYDGYFQQIRSFDSPAVQDFARRHVRPRQLKIVVVGKADEIRPQLQQIAPTTTIRPGQPVPPAEKSSPPDS